MPDKLRVRLRKSPISYTAKARGTVRALGLHRLHETVEVPDNPATRGMVRAVRFLVEVEAVPEHAPAPAHRRAAAPARAASPAASEAPGSAPPEAQPQSAPLEPGSAGPGGAEIPAATAEEERA